MGTIMNIPLPWLDCPKGNLASIYNRRLASAQSVDVPVFAQVVDGNTPVPNDKEHQLRFKEEEWTDGVEQRARKGSISLMELIQAVDYFILIHGK